MRRSGLVLVLMGLAACDDVPTDGANPGLFEPYMFNDLPYNVSFVSSTPVEDAALLAQGFTTSREIQVFRMAGEPFGAGDAAKAESVAAAFCTGGTLTFVPGAEAILDDSASFVFPRSCLEREG